MANCKTCAKALFDPNLGEYKCKARGHRIYDVKAYLKCKEYKRGEVKEASVTKTEDD